MERTTPTTKAVLTKAREILTPKKNWTQGTMARNSEGYMTLLRNEEAVCFCALGAVERAYYDLAGWDPSAAPQEVFDPLYEAVGEGGVALWNDRPSRTHEEVLAAFDRAIEASDG